MTFSVSRPNQLLKIHHQAISSAPMGLGPHILQELYGLLFFSPKYTMVYACKTKAHLKIFSDVS
jgi:hypothetical protein